nr:hypothetical protein [Paraburkholderia aromaticivorans]
MFILKRWQPALDQCMHDQQQRDGALLSIYDIVFVLFMIVMEHHRPQPIG